MTARPPPRLRLTTEENGEIAQPSALDVTRALDRLGLPGNGYAVLAGGDQTYIQTTGSRADGYIVEYRDGSESEHYSSLKRDVPHPQMVELFLAYHGGREWRSLIQWYKTSPGGAARSAGKSSFSRGHKLLLLLFCTIGVVSIVVGGVLAFNVRQLLEKAVEVPGTVVKMVRRGGSRGDTYAPIVEYTDHTGRLRVLHSARSSSPPSFYVGEKVVVVYDPADPEFPLHAKIRTFAELWSGTIFAVVFGSAFCAIAGAHWFILGHRRRNR